MATQFGVEDEDLGTDLIPDLNDHGALNDVLNQFREILDCFWRQNENILDDANLVWP